MLSRCITTIALLAEVNAVVMTIKLSRNLVINMDLNNNAYNWQKRQQKAWAKVIAQPATISATKLPILSVRYQMTRTSLSVLQVLSAAVSDIQDIGLMAMARFWQCILLKRELQGFIAFKQWIQTGSGLRSILAIIWHDRTRGNLEPIVPNQSRTNT